MRTTHGMARQLHPKRHRRHRHPNHHRQNQPLQNLWQRNRHPHHQMDRHPNQRNNTMTDIPWHQLNPRLQPHLGPPQITHKPTTTQNAPQQPKNPQPTDTQTTTPPNTTNWKNQANCKNQTHLMFPKKHKDITYIAQARKICNQCQVKTQCLNYALTFPAGDMHGVWAGLTPRQLAAEQRNQNIRPTTPTLAQMWSDLTRG